MSEEKPLSIDRRTLLTGAVATVAGFVMGCEQVTSSDPEIMKENLQRLKSFVEVMEASWKSELSKQNPDSVMVHEFFLHTHFSKLKYNEIAEKFNIKTSGENPVVLYEISAEDRERARISTNLSKAQAGYIPRLN